jgi:quinol monooxygenase YgiN
MADETPIQTVVEAHVAPEHWAKLTGFYRDTGQLPPSMISTSLVQNSADPTLWRAVSVWKSQAALEEYRRSVDVPGAIAMFRSAGGQPVVSLWKVAAAR